MLDEIVVSTDLHHYGAHKDSIVSTKDLLNQAATNNHFLIGDIVDRTNCLKKNLPKANDLLKDLRRLYGERYVLGNHEAVPVDAETPYYLHLKEEKTVLSHGDYYFWGLEKAQAFRSQNHGASWVYHKASMMFNEQFRANGIGLRDIGNDDLKRMQKDMASLGAKTLILGHNHPLKNTIITYPDFTVIILARGQHRISLSKARSIESVAARFH